MDLWKTPAVTSPALAPWDSRSDTERTVALEVLLHGPLSRSELARRLRLSPASLTRLVGPMVSGGLLEETGDAGTSALGDPPGPSGSSPTPDTSSVSGSPLPRRTASSRTCAPRSSNPPPPALTTRPRPELSPRSQPWPIVCAPRSRSTPYRLGVSLGGLVDQHARVRSAHFFGWPEPVDLAADLRRATGIPTVVDNDVMALTRAQSWFGLGRGLDRFALITLGVGIGLGVVMHGELIESPDAGLGLIQHFPLNDNGPVCPLGHRGCAQAMLSDDAIVAQASVALRRPVTPDEVLDLATQGQPAARTLVDQSGQALGRLVAAVANLTMCYRIIITGEGRRLASVAAAAMRGQISLERDPAAGELDIHTPDLGADDWARGPAVLAIQSLVRPTM